MSSGTGLLFSYLIGLIFLAGGIAFIVALDDNRFLYGIPYTVLGLLIVGGLYSAQRRTQRRMAEEAAADEGARRDPEAGPPG